MAGNASTALTTSEAEQRYEDSVSITTPVTTPISNTSIAMSITVDSGTDPATTTGTLPAPGVYVYTTTGSDGIDALTGAHHDYPATTTITVTPTSCGVQQRWDVLEQRWEVWQRCIDGSGVSEPGRANYDEFFGQSRTDNWVCTGAPRPLDAAPGTTWSTTCAGESSTDTFDGLTIGTEEGIVGTLAVATEHVQITITDDTTAGIQIIDTWYLTDTDLVIAQTSTASTSNDTQLGTVHDTENYEIHLTSLTPLG